MPHVITENCEGCRFTECVSASARSIASTTPGSVSTSTPMYVSTAPPACRSARSGDHRQLRCGERRRCADRTQSPLLARTSGGGRQGRAAADGRGAPASAGILKAGGETIRARAAYPLAPLLDSPMNILTAAASVRSFEIVPDSLVRTRDYDVQIRALRDSAMPRTRRPGSPERASWSSRIRPTWRPIESVRNRGRAAGVPRPATVAGEAVARFGTACKASFDIAIR